MPNGEAIDSTYDRAVVQTFRKGALRTAHIIDDQFPRYSDWYEKKDSNFQEGDLAIELYRYFRTRHIPCDIENMVDYVFEEFPEFIERIRKSDLVILDYNLREGDQALSTKIVRELARTEHFNTVIVYTADLDLDKVWLNLAMGLRGGWSSDSYTNEAREALARVIDSGIELPELSSEMLAAFVVGNNVETADPQVSNEFLEAFATAASVVEILKSEVLQAYVNDRLRDMLASDVETSKAELRKVLGSRSTGVARWLQSGNCFVTMINKRDEAKASDDWLFEKLDSALLAWHPNILQIVLSEIQNRLENGSIDVESQLSIAEPHTQLSLCYFLLDSLSNSSPSFDDEDYTIPIQILLDKLLEGLRQHIVCDSQSIGLATDLLKFEAKRINLAGAVVIDNPTEKSQRILNLAREMAGSGETIDSVSALIRLNAFLSTEKFRGDLTTGTVFRADETYWVCVSPACDMTLRPPGKSQIWSASLDPHKPMIAIRLKVIEDLKESLKEATENRQIFADIGTKLMAFRVWESSGGPATEFFFLSSRGKVDQGGSSPAFKASRVIAASKDVPNAIPSLEEVQYTIVAQLRANYASRLLQEAGHWLSRIGLDFVKMKGFPTKKA